MLRFGIAGFPMEVSAGGIDFLGLGSASTCGSCESLSKLARKPISSTQIMSMSRNPDDTALDRSPALCPTIYVISTISYNILPWIALRHCARRITVIEFTTCDPGSISNQEYSATQLHTPPRALARSSLAASPGASLSSSSQMTPSCCVSWESFFSEPDCCIARRLFLRACLQFSLGLGYSVVRVRAPASLLSPPSA